MSDNMLTSPLPTRNLYEHTMSIWSPSGKSEEQNKKVGCIRSFSLGFRPRKRGNGVRPGAGAGLGELGGLRGSRQPWLGAKWDM